MDYTRSALRTESIPPAPTFHLRMDVNGTLPQCNEQNGIRMIHALLGIQSEGGELADALKRRLFYGRQLDVVNVIEEIGDLCWYLAILADVCGVTLQYCMDANIAKLRARYPDKFTEHDAANRDLAAEREALEDARIPY